MDEGGEGYAEFLWSLFIGGVLGLIAGAILGKGSPRRRIWKYHYRLLGSWLGEFY